MILRPKNEEELQKREAVGIIRASRFVRLYAKSNKKIDFDVVCDIHKEIFKEAWPEICGLFRTEDLSITGSEILLCHHTEVTEKIRMANLELSEKLKTLKKVAGMIMSHDNPSEEVIIAIEDIVKTAAWLHHKITYIHPFREGNGRTARLAANLILERYGLVGISIKIEKENKNNYRKALAQIDQQEDYEPLENLIFEGILDRYNGVNMKYYEYKKC